ncbi:MAG: ABC transporter substrate-binding protein [Lachnospiraceae bacterium]|nr:ABC transporter substrate-binding protein [Lachnospiraceae bacterium]
MKRKNNRCLAAVLVACLSAGSLLACASPAKTATTTAAAAPAGAQTAAPAATAASEQSAAPDTQAPAAPSAAQPTETSAPAAPKSVSGEFTIWAHDDSLTVYNSEFAKQHPDVKVNLVVMDDDDIRTKLKAVLSAGGTPPDAVLIEIGMWQELMELPIWEDLTKAPYDGGSLYAEQYDYIRQMSTNAKGELVGMTNQATPAGYYYRRSIAKEALGTDDPAEIAKLLQDWDTVAATGKTVYEKTGRGLFSTINDVVQLKSNLSATPWVVGDRIMVTEDMLSTLDITKALDESKVLGRLEMWGPEWTADLENGEVSMGLFIATWLMPYNIKTDAASTKGDWGFAQFIGPQFMGGSWFGIPSGAANKEQAWAYISTVCGNHEFLEWFDTELGDFSSNKVVNEAMAVKYGPDEWWGGQNVLQAFSDVAGAANSSIMYPYQSTVLSCMRGAVREYCYNGATREEAVALLLNNFETRLPDLEIVQE